jgi:aminopeptidase N
VHAERLVHKLDTFTDAQRFAQQHLRKLIWWFYRELKAYARDPTRRRRSELKAYARDPTRRRRSELKAYARDPTRRRRSELKAYARDPTRRRRSELKARFERIFKRRTGFVMLDRLLGRLHANKAELLMVLERPEIPLHTNDSENDIRAQVTKRKISGGTRSDAGRACRDAFLGLMKTGRKLGISFWSYLGARLGIPDAPAVPPLADLVRARCAPP